MKNNLFNKRIYYHDPNVGEPNLFFLYVENGADYLGQMALNEAGLEHIKDMMDSVLNRGVSYTLVDSRLRIHTFKRYDIYFSRDSAIEAYNYRVKPYR